MSYENQTVDEDAAADKYIYSSEIFEDAPFWRKIMTRNTFPEVVVTLPKQKTDLPGLEIDLPESDADSPELDIVIPSGPFSTVKVLSYNLPHAIRLDETVALAVGYFSTGNVLITDIANRSKEGENDHMPDFVGCIEKDARSVGATVLTIVAGDIDQNLFLRKRYTTAVGMPPAFVLNLLSADQS